LIFVNFLHLFVCATCWTVWMLTIINHSFLTFPSSRVQTRPKPSDFSGEKILSMPSFGGDVKPSVPCCSFAARKKPLQFPWKSHCRLNLIGHFSPIIPPFADRGLSCHLTWSTSGDDGGN
jgi:hypothetical protein